MGFFSDIMESFAGKPSTAAPATHVQTPPPARTPEAQALFDHKKEALDLASQSATARGTKPTMTDYFIAAEQIGEKHGLPAQEWNAKIYSDLSGQQIDGFQINKADMEPSPAALRLARIRANTAQGRRASVRETLQELQKIQQSGEKAPSIESMKDEMDLDGDHTINDFFKDVDRHAKFEGTVFSNVNFHPAGTLMRDGENGVALTEGASFNHVSFDGMGADDNLKFVGKQFNDITFLNIKGGSITIPDGTQIDGMDIRGAHAELHIGRASVSNLDASDARVVRFEAAPGAEINHAKFHGTTIDMASEMRGSIWRDVEFKGANLVDVDMRGATLSNVRFADTDLSKLDLSGAKIENLRINGALITHPKQLSAAGITIDAGTSVSADPQLVRAQELANIRATMQKEVASIGTQSTPPAAPTMGQQPSERPAQAPAKSTITFDGNADLNNIGLTAAVASQPRTIALEDQASAMNMQRDRPA